MAASLSCAVLAVVWLAAPASAHGVLVGSDPAGGAVLARAPRVATLTFNETVVPGLSYARLVERSGRVVEGAVSAATGARLTLRLPELPTGAYGIAWRVLTKGDGHRTEGLVAFAVGSPPATPAPAAPGDAENSSAALTSDVPGNSSAFTSGVPGNRAGTPTPGMEDRATARGWARLCLLAGLAAIMALLRRVLVSRPRLPGLVVAGHDPVAVSVACAGAVLLLGAALLARGGSQPTPPASSVRPVPSPPPAVPVTATRGAVMHDLVVAVSVTPNRPGVNGFTVTAASSRRPPPAPIDAVVLESPAGGTPLRQLEPGRYVGTGELGAAASTRLTVVVLRGGKRFEVPIAWSVG
ncbi:copper resistance CopC family protein [Streptosporangium sp. NPDC051023]|uniref:copper resistance CopC family protein n=1 Tax=Streptosporangium sp. NPDC051023 TaxID=3155410 RepID=UPI00344E9B47